VSLSSEAAAVQYPMVRYAIEVGWEWLSPDDAVRLRRGEMSAVLWEVLVGQLQRLNPGVMDHGRAEEVAARLVRVRPTIEGNLDAWEYLRGLKTVFVPSERRERNVRLLDTNLPERNRFQVTSEFSFTNGRETIRPDVVFLVNGIPVLMVEAKAATRWEGIAEGIDQLRRYHRECPELLALVQAQSITQLTRFLYGATWSLSSKALLDWRDETTGSFEDLVRSFVHPERVLRVITDFILFTRRDEELAKVMLRPHQMRAVDRVVARAEDGKKTRGLVWHTQGSGKTYTMIKVAEKLITDPVFENPTVLMLVDRNELETQLFGNLEAVGFGHVEVAASKRHLEGLLRGDYRGVLVSTIHKFDEIAPNVVTRSNVFVLVDEAHRTTSADLGNFLMGALPNATFIGFTGTPIDRSAYGKGTFKVFGGGDPKGYLDKYSIRQSIEDGATVPLHYQLAPNELRVDRETLEREFLDLAEAEGVADVEELDRVLARAVTLGNMLKNPDRMRRVAAQVAEHFTSTVEPMGYKAFLVAVDREACARYKVELDRHLPPEYSTVVYSPGHNDSEELKRWHLSEDTERNVRKAFRKPDQLPKVLIVTEKLLTGFDAPILYAMYLDKPMRDHVLLQAIARVNRPYEDSLGRRKPSGLILDYVGVFEHLEKALAFDSEDVAGLIEDLDVLRRRFVTQMGEGRTIYLPIGEGKRDDKLVEAVLDHFAQDTEAREAFYSFFRELEELYEIISPDPFFRPYLDNYSHLAEMYRLLRVSLDPHVILDRSFLRKTAALVQERTHTGQITDPDQVYELDEAALKVLVGDDRPDIVKVFNLVKVLDQQVRQKGRHAPYLIPIGERAEQIALAFEQRQIDAKVALDELSKLLEEAQQAETTREASEFSGEGFSVFWLLQRDRVEGAEQVGRAMETAFSTHPHWRQNQGHERDVRIALHKALIDAGAKDTAPIVDSVLAVLRRSGQ
jgi:type I restriction enzyme R subunit